MITLDDEMYTMLKRSVVRAYQQLGFLRIPVDPVELMTSGQSPNRRQAQRRFRDIGRHHQQKRQGNPLQDPQAKGYVIPMEATLFHDFDNVTSYYGNVPNRPMHPNEHVEVYTMHESDRDPLDEDFTDAINRVCGTTLGYGDVDFFDARQCHLLAGWLEARLEQPITPRLEEIYRRFDDFARRAVKYDTGLVIEL